MARRHFHWCGVWLRGVIASLCVSGLFLTQVIAQAPTDPEGIERPATAELVTDHAPLLPDLAWEKLRDPAPLSTVAPYPPLPPNAVMGQFAKTIDQYSNNPELPEWMAPYVSMRLGPANELLSE